MLNLETQALTAASPGPAEACEFTAVVETRVHALREYRQQLDALARCALASNVFYEPWFLFPALEHYAAQARLVFVLVFATASSRGGDGAELCGFFPLLVRQRYHGIPLRHLALWRDDNIYLATPLVHRAHAAAVMRRFVDWFRASSEYKLLVGSQLEADGLLQRALDHALDSAGLAWRDERYERALLCPAGDADSYLARHASRNLRKQLRRKEKKLGAMGKLAYRALDDSDDLALWLSDFVRLEAAGWKGSRGAAIANSPAARRFFDTVCRAAFAQGRLMMLALTLEGQVIAMLINLRTDHGAFAFKVAYDEGFAACSPGTLLDLEMIRRIHLDGSPAWIDSCTDPGVTAFNHLFNERKAMRHLIVANRDSLATMAVRLHPLARRVKQRLNHSR